MMVVLVYPDGHRRPTEIGGIPRKDDYIALQDSSPGGPALRVDSITWAELDSNRTGPSVVISVTEERPRNGPRY